MISKILKQFFKIHYFILGIIIGIIFFSFFYLFNFEKKHQNLIYQNVFIDDIDFSGKSKEEVYDFFKDKSKKLKKIKFHFIFENQKIATFSGDQLNLEYDYETVWERAFYVGRSDFYLSNLNQKISSLLRLRKFNFYSNFNFKDDSIKNYLYSFKEQYDKPAKNALFEFKDNRVISFKKEEAGREIDIKKTLTEFENQLNSLKNKIDYDKQINIYKNNIKPEITLSSINNFGIEEFIASGKSDFTNSVPNRIHNIKTATSKFHGILIPPEKILSFNKTVGEISHLTGYKQAYIIKDGKTILGDGGGVCQVSTTLFRAALNAGLEIVERSPHAYRVSYYENDSEPGFDATVFDPYVDLKIKNNTPAYILIQTEINEEKNILYFHLYGKKDERKIEISKPVISDVIPPPDPLYQEDSSIKKGIIKQIDFPSWGAKSFFKYKVYKDNKLIIDKDFYSNYKPWRAVYLVGTAE